MINLNIFYPLSYGYMNAKVSALKAKLLAPSFYNEALNVSTVDGLIDLLTKTPYKRYIDAYVPYYSGVELIDISAAKRLSMLIRLIRKSIPKSDLGIYDKFISRWDILSLKAFMSKKHENFDEIEPYIIEGSVSLSTYKRMFKEKDMIKCLRLHPVGRAITELRLSDIPEGFRNVLLELMKTGNRTAYFSMLMDYLMLSNLIELSKAGGSFKLTASILKGIVEVKALITAERANERNMKFDASMFGLNTEQIKKKWFKMLDVREGESLFSVEQRAYKLIADRARKLMPLTIMRLDKATLFLLLLEYEVTNLHRIGVAKELNISKKDVEVLLL